MKRTRFQRQGIQRRKVRDVRLRRAQQIRPAFLVTPQDGYLPSVDSVSRPFVTTRLVIRDGMGRGIQI